MDSLDSEHVRHIKKAGARSAMQVLVFDAHAFAFVEQGHVPTPKARHRRAHIDVSLP